MKKAAYFFTAFAIALQAFGHHALAPHLTPSQLAIFETASRYLIWSSLWALLFSFQQWNSKDQWPLRLIGLGVCLFCGSLLAYLVFPFRLLMLLTPVGGLSMIVGFIGLGLNSERKSKERI